MEETDTPAEETPPFYDGRPIDSFKKDTLGRKGFARSFAEAIARHNGNESLVLAINAPWGDGKTSFKNMILTLLQQEQGDRVVQLEFTPWEWAGQHQVSEAFFMEIAKQLLLKDSSAPAAAAAKRLHTLGRILGLVGKVVGPTAVFLEPIVPGASLVMPVVGDGLTQASGLAKEAEESLKQDADEAKKSLSEIKKELREALQKYTANEKKLVLVVIDDIDRLTPDEIRLVFQMVKANADFPALVFLLLYDETYVVSALDQVFKADSRRFLEKIIQFQATLPVLADNHLRNHVEREIQRILANRPAYMDLFDKERFRLLWAGGIGHCIKNLRQAGRLLASYEFHMGVFQPGEAEINPVDLFVLEVLRQTESAFYKALYEQGDRFFPTSADRFVWATKKDKDSWAEIVDGFVAHATPKTKESSRFLLEDLFPHPGVGVSQWGPDGQDRAASRGRRLCHILYFNRYFRFAIDVGDVPDSEISDLATNLAVPARFTTLLKTHAGKGVLALALTKLLAREPAELSKPSVDLIAKLCDFAETLSDEARPVGLMPPAEAIRELVMLQVPDAMPSVERIKLLKDGIGASNSRFFPIQIVRHEDHREHHFSESNLYEQQQLGIVFSRSEVEELNGMVAAKLEPALLQDPGPVSPRLIEAMHWYLGFVPKNARPGTAKLLDHASCVAAMLHVVVYEQAYSDYRKKSPHLAKIPQVAAEKGLGLDVFDAALTKHEATISQMEEATAKRLDLYRDMRKRFPWRPGEDGPTEGPTEPSEEDEPKTS